MWEGKIAALDPAEALAMFRDSGLRASLCMPNVWSIMPNPRFPEPADPELRIEGIVASLDALAPFEPAAVMITPGGAHARPPEEARRILIDGMIRITGRAADLGLKIALEPIRKSNNGFISTFRDALDYIDAVGSDQLGVVLDIWHTWDDPDLRDTIAGFAQSGSSACRSTTGATRRGHSRIECCLVTASPTSPGSWPHSFGPASPGGTTWRSCRRASRIRSNTSSSDDLLTRARAKFDAVWTQAVKDDSAGRR